MDGVIDFGAVKRAREAALREALVDLEMEIADLWWAPSGKAWLSDADFDVLVSAMTAELPHRLAGWPNGAPFEVVAEAVVDVADETCIPGAVAHLSATARGFSDWVDQMDRIGDAVRRLGRKRA